MVKSKTFANSVGCDVVTADELPDWQSATGRIRVDGETWCEGTTAGPAHGIGEICWPTPRPASDSTSDT